MIAACKRSQMEDIMTLSDRFVFPLLAAVGLFLVSCAPARQVEVQPTVANLPETVAPTSSPTTPPTATTAPATPTVEPTIAIAPTPTSAPAASAPPDAATLVKELLATNAQCELPCWWGIQPGSAFTSTNVATITGVLS